VSGPAPAPVLRLTGVYDANGSAAGELSYLIGRSLGVRHCALCDITHGRLREKEAWRAARRRLPVPVTAVHLDERDADERAASEGRAPCVLAHTADGVDVLLGPGELEACAGDPERLVDALIQALSDVR
jgi:hypothetical protein